MNCQIFQYFEFRYLLPCNHILPNQKRTIKSVDYYCKSATMFLYLTPSCCIETNKHNGINEQDGQSSGNSSPRSNRSSESPKVACSSKKEGPKAVVGESPQIVRKSSAISTASYSSVSSIQPELRPQDTLDFIAYLQDAKAVISACKQDCKCWSAVYDGMDVVTENPRDNKYSKQLHSTSSSFGRVERTVSDSSTDSAIEEARYNETITTDVLGPFLNAIFDKLETMLDSNVYVNLLLTSLVARLACYPQPLLRSFLLNSNLVIRPGVRSLALVSKVTSLFCKKFQRFS